MSKSKVKKLIEDSVKLTAEEQVFCGLVAKGMSGTLAYRKAFPLKSHLTNRTVRQYASDLLTKTDISSEVATRVETQSRLARLAEQRLEDILVNDSSSEKGSKVAEVSMFMYEQANGKATQKIQMESKHVVFTMNLTGDGELPPEKKQEPVTQ